MLEISKNANPNYLAKVVKLEGLRKHDNADRLQCVDIDFQTVITGLDAKDGDIYVYFPVECKINSDFLSHTNSFRDYKLNADYLQKTPLEQEFLNTDSNKELRKAGFFEENCRVKAMKLRGEKSMGYIVPSFHISAWANFNITKEDINKEFDIISGKKLVEKYVVKHIQQQGSGKSKSQKRIERISRMVEGQVHLHQDTENLRKNAHKIKPEDTISITYKTHGTSFWVSNVQVKRELKWYEKLSKRLGFKVQEKEYDIVYGSRKVIKNEHFIPKTQKSFYKVDIWKHIANTIGDKIPKGYTLYGEALGYLPGSNSYIQKPFDYGCKEGEYKIEIYRITYTNEDGLVTELFYPQIVEFCKKTNLNPSTLFYYGKAVQIGAIYFNDEETLIPQTEEHVKQWQSGLVKYLEEKYNEKDCFMCNNKVPEEGIVLRKEKLFGFEAYKLKSFRFLEFETKQLDKGEVNIEDNE